MEDFSLNPVGRLNWSTPKAAIDPRKRQRHHDQPAPDDEPVDSVVLSSETEEESE